MTRTLAILILLITSYAARGEDNVTPLSLEIDFKCENQVPMTSAYWKLRFLNLEGKAVLVHDQNSNTDFFPSDTKIDLMTSGARLIVLGTLKPLQPCTETKEHDWYSKNNLQLTKGISISVTETKDTRGCQIYDPALQGYFRDDNTTLSISDESKNNLFSYTKFSKPFFTLASDCDPSLPKNTTPVTPANAQHSPTPIPAINWLFY